MVDIKNNNILVDEINSVMFDNIEADTYCGLISGKFENDNEIKEKLNVVSMPEIFSILKGKVSGYYEGN